MASTSDTPKKVAVPSSAPPAVWARLKSLARQRRHAPTAAEQALWERLRRRQIAGADVLAAISGVVARIAAALDRRSPHPPAP